MSIAVVLAANLVYLKPGQICQLICQKHFLNFIGENKIYITFANRFRKRKPVALWVNREEVKI